MDANVMLIDDNKMNSIDNNIMWYVVQLIQKGKELCLDGFFGIELIPKNNDVDKFNFEGKLSFVKNEHKVYAIALIVAIIILPCNIKIEIRTDLNIIEWLYSYKLKNVKMLVKDGKAKMQKTIQDGKKAHLDHESNGRNITIDWSASFKLINNEITTSKNVTNRDDATIRSFRVKNFLKFCQHSPRCSVGEGTWEHLWIYSKTDGDVYNEEEKVRFKERIIDRSLIAGTENLIHEIKRGIVNKKWWTLCKIKGQREKTFGNYKRFKKKEKEKDENSDTERDEDVDKNSKDDVSRLGISDRKLW
ncbi:hypothetical protein RhiirC2_778426 [Rhizophagus irregularis]|uniref:Uncharacterized protein n=1 Tax=Rhizophagus irregularis TaxID=588596 RepID=A0A2N1NBY9_9GLOM|nr:hypothetical protein RhiirC2_778426 [Rhizophagus irregularis]